MLLRSNVSGGTFSKFSFQANRLPPVAMMNTIAALFIGTGRFQLWPERVLQKPFIAIDVTGAQLAAISFASSSFRRLCHCETASDLIVGPSSRFLSANNFLS